MNHTEQPDLDCNLRIIENLLSACILILNCSQLKTNQNDTYYFLKDRVVEMAGRIEELKQKPMTLTLPPVPLRSIADRISKAIDAAEPRYNQRCDAIVKVLREFFPEDISK